MTIKSKISFYISLFFTFFFGLICVIVISIYSNFRKEEFKARLHEKAMTTARLYVEVKEIDNHLLSVIDSNTIHQLYNEKTLVFDTDFKLLYSSIDDHKVLWSVTDLKYLKKQREFFKKNGDNEYYGMFYDSHHKDYYVLISANDNYGKRKLNFLIYLLLSAYFVFTVSTWVITFFIVKKQLRPLNSFHAEISQINEQNMDTTLAVEAAGEDEISLLSKEFNFMMSRIQNAYLKQKEFTAQASHELRTPLARLSMQIENQFKNCLPEQKLIFQRLLFDVNRLNELIQSLLILSKIDTRKVNPNEQARLDETLFNSIEKVTRVFPEMTVNLNLLLNEEEEHLLEINANASLLEIAFENLLRNAYLYSENGQAQLNIRNENGLILEIQNNGELIPEEDREKLFKAFMRGSNAKSKNGLGLGLRIVERILTFYHFSIFYAVKANQNLFTIRFGSKN